MADASSGLRTSATLLERVRVAPAGQQAWEEFVQRYGRKIYAWCRQWGLQEADAEDVTHDVLLHLAAKMRDFAYHGLLLSSPVCKMCLGQAFGCGSCSRRGGSSGTDSKPPDSSLPFPARWHTNRRLFFEHAPSRRIPSPRPDPSAQAEGRELPAKFPRRLGDEERHLAEQRGQGVGRAESEAQPTVVVAVAQQITPSPTCQGRQGHSLRRPRRRWRWAGPGALQRSAPFCNETDPCFRLWLQSRPARYHPRGNCHKCGRRPRNTGAECESNHGRVKNFRKASPSPSPAKRPHRPSPHEVRSTGRCRGPGRRTCSDRPRV
jgi:hypothetical protein